MHPVGRNGMHKYNNQDHSMLTAMLTVENIPGTATTTSGRSTSRRTTTRTDEIPLPTWVGTGDDGGTGRDAPVVPAR